MYTLANPPELLPQANDPCWCGSGRKYKRCHRRTEGRVLQGVVTPMRTVPPHIARPSYADTGTPLPRGEARVKSPEIIERMRHAGAVAAEILRLAGEFVRPGITTDEIDEYVHQLHIERDAYPSPLNYNGFPKSVCTSANEVICHGIPDSRVLQDGDILNLDVTAFVDGVHGDTNATFFVGDVDPVSRRAREGDRGVHVARHRGGQAGPPDQRRRARPSRTTPRRTGTASSGPSSATASARSSTATSRCSTTTTHERR